MESIHVNFLATYFRFLQPAQNKSTPIQIGKNRQRFDKDNKDKQATEQKPETGKKTPTVILGAENFLHFIVEFISIADESRRHCDAQRRCAEYQDHPGHHTNSCIDVAIHSADTAKFANHINGQQMKSPGESTPKKGKPAAPFLRSESLYVSTRHKPSS